MLIKYAFFDTPLAVYIALFTDIDECKRSPGICESDCINTEGSFKCSCPRGYQSVGDNCEGTPDRSSLTTFTRILSPGKASFVKGRLQILLAKRILHKKVSSSNMR